MFVVNLIQRAVAGTLRFDFIDSEITALQNGSMSSQKGSAHSVASRGGFAYQFLPRAPLPGDWADEGGYLDAGHPNNALRGFQITGIERNSAAWHGKADRLQLRQGTEGMSVTGIVREWTRVDKKAVHSPFVRVIVPGRRRYPTLSESAPGNTEPVAVLGVGGMRVEIRDYGNYSEVITLGGTAVPDGIADSLVQALGQVLERDLQWVYGERHNKGARIISVRSITQTDVESMPAGAVLGNLPAYEDFWQSYKSRLAELLAE